MESDCGYRVGCSWHAHSFRCSSSYKTGRLPGAASVELRGAASCQTHVAEVGICRSVKAHEGRPTPTQSAWTLVWTPASCGCCAWGTAGQARVFGLLLPTGAPLGVGVPGVNQMGPLLLPSPVSLSLK